MSEEHNRYMDMFSKDVSKEEVYRISESDGNQLRSEMGMQSALYRVTDSEKLRKRDLYIDGRIKAPDSNIVR